MDAWNLENATTINLIKSYIANIHFIRIGTIVSFTETGVSIQDLCNPDAYYNGTVISINSTSIGSYSAELAEGDNVLCLFLDKGVATQDYENEASSKNNFFCIAIPFSFGNNGSASNVSVVEEGETKEYKQPVSISSYGKTDVDFVDLEEEAAVSINAGDNRPVSISSSSDITYTVGKKGYAQDDDTVYEEVETSVSKQYSGLTDVSTTYGKSAAVKLGYDINGEEIECAATLQTSSETSPAVTIGKSASVEIAEDYDFKSCDGNVEVKCTSDDSVSVTAFKTTVKIDKDGGVTIETEKDVSVKTSGGDVAVTAEQGNATVEATAGTVQLKGNQVKITGTVTPSGSGALCGIPYCAFSGAPHTGDTSMGAT